MDNLDVLDIIQKSLMESLDKRVKHAEYFMLKDGKSGYLIVTFKDGSEFFIHSDSVKGGK